MNEYVLALSYGNYLIQNGGTDKVIREHCEMFKEVGYDYIFIFPVVKNICVGKLKKNIRFWGLNKNEQFLGIFSFKNVLKELKEYQKSHRCLATFIHHIWRVDETELMQLCDLNTMPVYYYLHDFQSICENRNFIDGEGKFCGYSLNGLKCNQECSYYVGSVSNRKIFRNLMKKLGQRIICIGPSENTRDIFAASFDEFKTQFVAIEHQKSTMLKPILYRNVGRLRVAYIGAQVPIKGWNDFKEIKSKLEKLGYDLYYFGTGRDVPDGVKAVSVSVREQGNTAMQEALQANNIDVVLLLSCWPETYSYTYYESYAAGCYVLTYRSSGNMADQVTKKKNGKVFENLYELEEYLENLQQLKNDVFEYWNSGIQTPVDLIPNDDIVKMIKGENIVASNMGQEKKDKFRHRAYVAELVYRLQNGRKLNGK